MRKHGEADTGENTKADPTIWLISDDAECHEKRQRKIGGPVGATGPSTKVLEVKEGKK